MIYDFAFRITLTDGTNLCEEAVSDDAIEYVQDYMNGLDGQVESATIYHRVKPGKDERPSMRIDRFDGVFWTTEIIQT